MDQSRTSSGCPPCLAASGAVGPRFSCIWSTDARRANIRKGPVVRPGLSLLLRGQDLNLRPLGYEPSELPNCSTPRREIMTLPRGGGCRHIGAAATGPSRHGRLERGLHAGVGLGRRHESLAAYAACTIGERLSGSRRAPAAAPRCRRRRRRCPVGAVPVSVRPGPSARSVPRHRSARRRHRPVAPESPPNSVSSAASRVSSKAILSPNDDQHLAQQRVARVARRLHVDGLHVEQSATDGQGQQVAADRPRSRPAAAG